MRNAHYLNMGQHAYIAMPFYNDSKRQQSLPLRPPRNAVASTLDALKKIEVIVSDGCLNHPETLTQDDILAYALALLQLRECAGIAQMERLMNACDALAVTVSTLIDDRANASPKKCEALSRFVVHARDMILMSENESAECVIPPLNS
ncbi:MAG: hypothetical protein GZ085_06735 [Sulfuriferula multivorans]|uniref:Uncharacterized protein n=1 Tax=Sulfuriferula multivorans TaxID=1559896 RepID=A0A7C9NR10_9PROT|nr:hypothetical protein [Sulfuriferula multivorans]